MGKIFQLRTKKKINQVIDAGFLFNVPSGFTSRPTDKEIQDALEKIGGKQASVCSSFSSDKYEIVS